MIYVVRDAEGVWITEAPSEGDAILYAGDLRGAEYALLEHGE